MAEATLADVNSTLLSIKQDTFLTRKALIKDAKETSAETATEGLKERTAIEKPKMGGGSDKSLGQGLIDAVKSGLGTAFDWTKWFGLIGLGILFKDQITEFLAGAFAPLKDMVMDWWDGTFLPALKDLDKAINPFSDDKGLFSTVIEFVGDFAERVKTKLTDMGNALNTMIEDLTGFSIKDMIFGKMGFDEEGNETGREGGIAGYLNKVGEGFINFGTSIGILDKDGNVSLGAKLGLGGIAAALLAIKGPGLIIKGLFSALSMATTALLGLGGRAKKGVGGAAAGGGKEAKGGGRRGGRLGGLLKVGAMAAGAVGLGSMFGGSEAEAAPAKPKPGDVVTSKSGNKVYAGVDGKPSATKVGDTKGLAAIKKAAASAPAAAAAAPAASKSPASKPAGASKFPRMKTLLGLGKKIPMVGTLFAAGDLIRILNEPGDVKSKVDDIAGLLGGLGGATLGTIAGATVGSVVPLAGTAIGGLVGGVGGYFMGDMVAQGLAQWLLGQKVDAFPGMINDMINGKEPPETPLPTADAVSMGGGASPTVDKPKVPSVAPGGAVAGAQAAKTATVNDDAVQKAVADAKASSGTGSPIIVPPSPPAPPAKSGDKTDTIIIEMGKTKADITRSTMF